jgi:hypothetical protein
MASVTLKDGRTLEVREPTAGELRGIKLLDLLMLDAGAHADLVPRITDLERPEFLRLGPADLMAVMSAVVGFFAPTETDQAASPPPSKTPGK